MGIIVHFSFFFVCFGVFDVFLCGGFGLVSPSSSYIHDTIIVLCVVITLHFVCIILKEIAQPPSCLVPPLHPNRQPQSCRCL